MDDNSINSWKDGGESMNLIYVGFGSFTVPARSGLRKVSNNLRIISDGGLKQGAPIKFVLLGNEDTSTRQGHEYKWEGAALHRKLVSIIRVLLYINTSRSTSIIVSGSPLLYACCLLRKDRTVVQHHGLVSKEFRCSRKDKMNIVQQIDYWWKYMLISTIENVSFYTFTKHTYYNEEIEKLIARDKQKIYLPNPVLYSCSVNKIEALKDKAREIKEVTKVKIVSVAYYTKRKNLALIDPFFDNIPKDKYIQLNICGNICEEYRAEFWQVFKRIAERDNIELHYYENLSDVELERFYYQSHFLIHPSLAEGFPLVAQEAISKGCMIIAHPSVINRVVPQKFIYDITKGITDTLHKYDKADVNKAIEYARLEFSPEKFLTTLSNFVLKE